MTLKVMRPSGENAWDTVYEETMSELGTLTVDPMLEDGDLVLMETEYRRTLGWLDALNIMSSVAASIFLVDRLITFFGG